jgi:two-component system NtrC family sensor kinase
MSEEIVRLERFIDGFLATSCCDPTVVPLDINALLKKISVYTALQARSAGVDMALECGSIRPLRVNTFQLEQAILNLLNNAIDAIMERHPETGGRLDIQAHAKDEKWIEIRVTDNGSGIQPENIEKVFSPFFTTKPVGKGTGLGLSVCYGIIENFGGTMDVTSRVNEGTTFIITLPGAETKAHDR